MVDISERNKGLLTGAVMILVCLILFYLLHQQITRTNEYLVFAIYIAGICWSLVAYHRKQTSKTFKDYFSAAFKTFVVASLLIVLFIFIFNKLNPQIRDKMIAENNALLIKDGSRTPAEVQANAAKVKELYLPFTLMATTIKYLFLGALISVVGAGFLSSKKAT